MEALLGKACKQAVSSLAQMRGALTSANSKASHVCAVSTTRMLCPDLVHQLDTAVQCLENIPIILERTLQLGRENEFYFEVMLWLPSCNCTLHAAYGHRSQVKHRKAGFCISSYTCMQPAYKLVLTDRA